MMEKTEIAKPPHNRKLGLCGVSLTKARLPKNDDEAANLIRDEIESIIIKSGYLDGAQFSWVTIAIRYGLKNEEKPHYQQISKKYGDLPLAIEVDTHEMLGASLKELKQIYSRAVLLALTHAGRKYNQPIEKLEAALKALQYKHG